MTEENEGPVMKGLIDMDTLRGADLLTNPDVAEVVQETAHRACRALLEMATAYADFQASGGNLIEASLANRVCGELHVVMNTLINRRPQVNGMIAGMRQRAGLPQENIDA